MTLLFVYPGNEALAASYIKVTGISVGKMKVHRFPDKESLVQIDTDIRGKDVLLMCSLDRPDSKTMSILFFSKTAKELGAKSVGLIAPYLGYMRQDARFKEGEAVTSNIYANILSQHFDRLVTVDPHLHRYNDMSEIYSIPTKVIHAAEAVGDWIKNNVMKPVLIGPDSESDQWARDIAGRIVAPYIILKKTRYGDRDVEISAPELKSYPDYTPVLVDDIISTAHTMASTVKLLIGAGAKKPVCVGIHAVFAEDAFNILNTSGASNIVTCNTIAHETNRIDIGYLLAE